jgi:diketogulonate reductase-like aldo/keto reductase
VVHVVIFKADGTYERDDSATFLDSWPEMEKTLESGKVRAIGVSNFSIMKYSFYSCLSLD